MKPILIIIRGSPASGKSTLARNLVKNMEGKVALLTVDEFRWVMTAHNIRDKKDYDISFDNFLYSLTNYLKSGYTIIVEDAWIRKHKDKATNLKKVLTAGKKFNAEIKQVLLEGSWNTVKHINTLRPMVIPQKELKELFEKVCSKTYKNEISISIDNKKPKTILEETKSKLFL